MKRYHAGRRRLGVLCLFAAALAAALWFVRSPFAELVRTHVNLLFSGGTRFATAAQRADWLEKHPGELRLALVGNWSASKGSPTGRCAAFERAIGEINAAGGARGRKLSAEWIDVGGDGIVLQAELLRLAADPSYFAVMTALTADPLLAMKPILLEGRLITLAPGVTNRRLTPEKDLAYVFAPNPSDMDVADAIAEWIGGSETNRLVFCHGRSEESTGQAEELQRVFLMRGIRDCPRVPIMDGWMWSEAREIILRMRNFGRVRNSVLLLEERDTPADAQQLDWMLRQFPGKVLLSRPCAVTAEVPADRILVPRRVTAAEASYRSVYLLADALEKSPGLNPDDVSKTLQTAELKTPTGPFRFAKNRFEKVGKITFSPPAG